MRWWGLPSSQEQQSAGSFHHRSFIMYPWYSYASCHGQCSWAFSGSIERGRIECLGAEDVVVAARQLFLATCLLALEWLDSVDSQPTELVGQPSPLRIGLLGTCQCQFWFLLHHSWCKSMWGGWFLYKFSNCAKWDRPKDQILLNPFFGFS